MCKRSLSNDVELTYKGSLRLSILRIQYRVGIVLYILKRHYSPRERCESVSYWFCSDIIVTNDVVCNIPWRHWITWVCNKFFSHHHTCLYEQHRYAWSTRIVVQPIMCACRSLINMLSPRNKESVVWDIIRLDILHRVRVRTYGVPSKTR